MRLKIWFVQIVDGGKIIEVIWYCENRNISLNDVTGIRAI